MRTRFGRAAILTGTAAAGILVAHELDYRLVVPDPLHRHDLLFRTGHGYMARGAMLVLVVGLVAAIAQAALGFVRERGGVGPGLSVRGTATRLAFAQSGAFVTLEAVERLMVGSPPDDRLALVTFVGVAVLWVLARVGRAVARALASTPAPVRTPSRTWHGRSAHRPRGRARRVRPIRGPPLLAR